MREQDYIMDQRLQILENRVTEIENLLKMVTKAITLISTEMEKTL